MKLYQIIISMSFVAIAHVNGADSKPLTSTEAAKSAESDSSERKETLPFGLRSSMTVDQIKSKLEEKSFLTFEETVNGEYDSGIQNVRINFKAKNFDLNEAPVGSVAVYVFNSKIESVSLRSTVNFEPEEGANNLVNFYKFFVENNYKTITNNIDEIKTGADLGRSSAVFRLKASDDDGVYVNIFTTMGTSGKFASLQSVDYTVEAVRNELNALEKEMSARKNSATLDKLK